MHFAIRVGDGHGLGGRPGEALVIGRRAVQTSSLRAEDHENGAVPHLRGGALDQVGVGEHDGAARLPRLPVVRAPQHAAVLARAGVAGGGLVRVAVAPRRRLPHLLHHLAIGEHLHLDFLLGVRPAGAVLHRTRGLLAPVRQQPLAAAQHDHPVADDLRDAAAALHAQQQPRAAPLGVGGQRAVAGHDFDVPARRPHRRLGEADLCLPQRLLPAGVPQPRHARVADVRLSTRGGLGVEEPRPAGVVHVEDGAPQGGFLRDGHALGRAPEPPLGVFAVGHADVLQVQPLDRQPVLLLQVVQHDGRRLPRREEGAGGQLGEHGHVHVADLVGVLLDVARVLHGHL
mmetsp:Transcript_4492/g.11223  ORF Transcript_4492/g.11223 Transcript_4492/m.11223 type:complete len:343 (+) Transcript_4492:812-1840(+)